MLALLFILQMTSSENTGDKVGDSELKGRNYTAPIKTGQRTEEELANLQQATSAAAKSSTEDAAEEDAARNCKHPRIRCKNGFGNRTRNHFNNRSQ